MRPVTVSLSNLTNNANAICLSQTMVGAGDLVLNGASVTSGIAALGAAQPISLASSANLSGVNFTVIGKDANNNLVEETLAGPNNNAVITEKYFLSVAQIAVDAAVGTAVTVGALNANGAASPTIAMNWRSPNYNVAYSLKFSSGSTSTATIQKTFDDIQTTTDLTWYDSQIGGVSSKTNIQDEQPCTGSRLLVKSYTATDVITLTAVTGGYALGG